MITVKQMEFGINAARIARLRVLKARSNRSKWWFQKMHSAVEKAIDWKPSERRAEELVRS